MNIFYNRGISTTIGLIIIIAVAILATGGIFAYQYFQAPKEEVAGIKTQNGNQTQQQKACTQEAKVCPDGSSVGRTGPNCEFATCPPAKIGETPKEIAVKFLDYSSISFNFAEKVEVWLY